MSTHAPSAPRPSSLLALAGFGAAVLLTAVVGGVAAASSAEQYAALDRPAFAPPGWVFGPVWSVLYVLIAVAGWLVWREVGLDRSIAVYAVQLALNAAWTPLFFAAQLYGLALVEILLLGASIVVVIAMFARRRRAAAWLLAPYLAWVGFATALNAAIWAAN